MLQSRRKFFCGVLAGRTPAKTSPAKQTIDYRLPIGQNQDGFEHRREQVNKYQTSDQDVLLQESVQALIKIDDILGLAETVSFARVQPVNVRDLIFDQSRHDLF
jgi:hypothetical protein